MLLQVPRSPEMVCALTKAKEELQELLSSCFSPLVTSAAHEYLLILQQLTNSSSTLTGIITAKLWVLGQAAPSRASRAWCVQCGAPACTVLIRSLHRLGPRLPHHGSLWLATDAGHLPSCLRGLHLHCSQPPVLSPEVLRPPHHRQTPVLLQRVSATITSRPSSTPLPASATEFYPEVWSTP